MRTILTLRPSTVETDNNCELILTSSLYLVSTCGISFPFPLLCDMTTHNVLVYTLTYHCHSALLHLPPLYPSHTHTREEMQPVCIYSCHGYTTLPHAHRYTLKRNILSTSLYAGALTRGDAGTLRTHAAPVPLCHGPAGTIHGRNTVALTVRVPVRAAHRFLPPGYSILQKDGWAWCAQPHRVAYHLKLPDTTTHTAGNTAHLPCLHCERSHTPLP